MSNEDCIFCHEKHTKKYLESMEYRTQHNKWDHVGAIIKTLEKVKDKEWSWVMNSKCKYVEIRLDMRDGGCIIKDRHGSRISPKQLEYQYSAATPNPIADSEAYKEE